MNDVDLRRASHDEAAAALKATAGSGRQVRLTVQYRPEDYNRYEARLHEIQQTMTGTLVRTSPKRTLYVRALFDYDPAKERTKATFENSTSFNDLSFSQFGFLKDLINLY